MSNKKGDRKKNYMSNSIKIFGVSITLLSMFFVGIEWNKRYSIGNVKGESTENSSNFTKSADAGGACGVQIKKTCVDSLVCAPIFVRKEKKIITGSGNISSSTGTEQVSSEEVTCLDPSGNTSREKCRSFLPAYGVCVKKGVWPPPANLLSRSCVPPQPPCTGTMCPMYDLPPNVTFCTPTPSTSEVKCRWCGNECVNGANKMMRCTSGNIEGYACINKENTCVKVLKDEVSPPVPPNGCRYKKVQCVKEPCNPILDCPVEPTERYLPL